LGDAAPEQEVIVCAGADRARQRECAVDVVVPLLASTSRMPLLTVCAPPPPTLLTKSAVEPLPEPPEITSLSDGEPSLPRRVFSEIRPLAPT
jgi:hypothetical protein